MASHRNFAFEKHLKCTSYLHSWLEYIVLLSRADHVRASHPLVILLDVVKRLGRFWRGLDPRAVSGFLEARPQLSLGNRLVILVVDRGGQ